MGLLNPAMAATFLTLGIPARFPTRMDMVFRERMRPVEAGSMPPNLPSEFCGCHPLPPVISPGWRGPSLIREFGGRVQRIVPHKVQSGSSS